MPTSFPISLDNLSNPTPSTSLSDLSLGHAAQHTSVNDAIEALQAKVGINGSSNSNSLDYKITQLQSAPIGGILHSRIPAGDINTVLSGTDTVTSSYSISIPNDGKTYILSASCWAQTNYAGPSLNAGVISAIALNGDTIMKDLSFEGESASVDFNSCSSVSQILLPGTHTLELIGKRGSGSVTMTINLKRNWHVVAYD